MDVLTAPALLSTIVGTLVGMPAGLFWMLAKGHLVTRREADGITKRAEKAEDTRDSLIAQNTELMEMARLGQATFTALRGRVEEA